MFKYVVGIPFLFAELIAVAGICAQDEKLILGGISGMICLLGSYMIFRDETNAK